MPSLHLLTVLSARVPETPVIDLKILLVCFIFCQKNCILNNLPGSESVYVPLILCVCVSQDNKRD